MPCRMKGHGRASVEPIVRIHICTTCPVYYIVLHADKEVVYNTRDNTPPYDTLPHDWKCKIWDHLHYIVECQVAPNPVRLGKKGCSLVQGDGLLAKPLWENGQWVMMRASVKLLPHVTRRSLDMRNSFWRNEQETLFKLVTGFIVFYRIEVFDRSQSRFDMDGKCCIWSCSSWPCVRSVISNMNS